MRRRLLPFWNERKAKVDMIVLHAVAYAPEQAIKIFEAHQVSSHYLVGEDGEIWQLVGEKHRAWHAGSSVWQGCDDINSRSIGIEFCSSSLGQTPYSKAQLETAFLLLRRLIRKYKIKQDKIVGHSDIAPSRKPDPGKAFFWKELAEEGIGLWYNLKDADKIDNVSVVELLKLIGYDVRDESAAVCAFCRRFLPERIESRPIDALIENPVQEVLQADEKFIKALKAAAYRYLNASKAPCKM